MSDTYEYVPATELRPGDTIRLNQDDTPVVLTEVRVNFFPDDRGPNVIIYRHPTDEEYASHLEEHGTDLRAAWLCSCVGWFPILRQCVPQTGNLVH